MRRAYSAWESFPAKLEDAHQAALQIEEAIAGQLCPGKKSREIWSLSEAEGARMGYQDFLGGPPGSKAGFVGHGVGLQIDEYPVIGPVDHEICREHDHCRGAEDDLSGRGRGGN